MSPGIHGRFVTVVLGAALVAEAGCNARTLGDQPACEAPADGGQDPLADPGACESYLADPPAANAVVSVRVENRTARVAYVPQYLLCRAGHVQLTGVAGEREVLSPRDCSEVGQQLCSEFAGGSFACGLVCVDTPVIRIEPGAAAEVSLPDALYVRTELPDQCGENEVCVAPAPIVPGDYELRALLYPCEDDPDAECECEPNEDGWCELAPTGEFFPRDDLQEVTTSWNGVCDPVLIID